MLNRTTIERIIAHTETGAAAGCPFCRGRMITEVTPGQKIRMLNGFKARRLMTVTASVGWSLDEFLASYDDNNDGSEYRVIFMADRFCYENDFQAQDWMPNLSVDDVDAIEESFVEMLRMGDGGDGWEWTDKFLFHIVGTVWWRRLPVDGSAISKQLKARGFDAVEPRHIEQMFDFGRELLVATNGRPPIKRIAMKPLKHGRYRTSKKAELEHRLFGTPSDN